MCNSQSYWSILEWLTYTVWCGYSAVNFLLNPHKGHPIARPWGWSMGCLLWVLCLTYVLPLHRSAECNIMTNVTVLQRHSTVYIYNSIMCNNLTFCTKSYRQSEGITGFFLFFFYPRPVLAFGYCRCLCLCVCVCLSLYLSVCQSRICPYDNSSPVQARITKIGAQMQNTFLNVPIVLWGDRPWPSRSNLTWKSNFTSFWDCPDDNLSSVQAIESPNLDQKCILVRLRSLLIWGLINLDLQGQF